MDEQTLRYDDGRVQAEITVAQATVLRGMQRTRLMAEGQEALRAAAAEDETPPDLDRLILRAYTYPDLLAGSLAGQIRLAGEALAWPPDFEAYLALPADLGAAWEQAVYAANPGWLPEPPEKKAPMPSTDA
jgi:hypothetical protein